MMCKSDTIYVNKKTHTANLSLIIKRIIFLIFVFGKINIFNDLMKYLTAQPGLHL